jgi:hypothetical protein
MTSSPQHSHLQLISRDPQPRHRYEVRIAVSATRMPVGRSRAFRLTESDIQLLVETARRMEARA